MWTEWGLSVLNGILGDYLRDRRNGLAIEMAFYHRNRPLTLGAESLLTVHPKPTAKICFLVHGLGCNEGVWAFRDGERGYSDINYGTLLQEELGYTPFYLRYNTGLAIADNGDTFANLLGELLSCYPGSVEEIALIGHSMGGLVLRRACHTAVQHRFSWVKQIKRVIDLGTPHEGADLERLGSMAVAVLQTVPNPVTRLIGSILNKRSRGVKDLCDGNRPDQGSRGDTQEEQSPASRGAVLWPEYACHCRIAGTLSEDPRHPVGLLVGDGLVRPPPSPGSTSQCRGSSGGPKTRVRIFPGLDHIELAHNREVYRQIVQWCSGEGDSDFR